MVFLLWITVITAVNGRNGVESGNHDAALELNFDITGRDLSLDAKSRQSVATVYLKKTICISQPNNNSIKTTKKIHRSIHAFLQLFHYYLYLTWSRKNSKGHWYISMLTAPIHSPGTIPVAKNRYSASLHEASMMGNLQWLVQPLLTEQSRGLEQSDYISVALGLL